MGAARVSLVVLFLLAALTGCSADKQVPSERSAQDRDLFGTVTDPAWHIARLKAKDLRMCGGNSQVFKEPFHVWMLYEIGGNSVVELMEKELRDDAPVGQTYIGVLSWRGGAVLGDNTVRQATIGDIADYVLRVLYKTDVGYRSYLSPKQRDEAIARWQERIRTGPERPSQD